MPVRLCTVCSLSVAMCLQEHALELAAKNEELRVCSSNQEQSVSEDKTGKVFVKSPLSPSNTNYKERVASLEKDLKVWTVTCVYGVCVCTCMSECMYVCMLVFVDVKCYLMGVCPFQTQQLATHRAQSLCKERYQETISLQEKIKQLAKVDPQWHSSTFP